jgi:hypothetical protein
MLRRHCSGPSCLKQRPFVALAGGQEIGAQARFDAGAAEFGVELAAGGEDGVAEDFGFHALDTVERTFQFVALRTSWKARSTFLPIRRRHQDHLVQRFEAAAVLR